ncbi:MAG: hypothetical protein B1H11_06120 [Desulfobacteraceae bacterium 4484_190.1]|nr:MAG: hypothetical protein B1H11_06120 [Desulfobacteraceae bacterium 4484_190.1]
MKAFRLKSIKNWGIVCACIFVVLFASFSAYYLWDLLKIGTAYKAKILCSGIFVSKRPADAVLSKDLMTSDLVALKWIDTHVDYTSQSVCADFFGLAKAKAIYRPGLGCTLVIGTDEEGLRSHVLPIPIDQRVKKKDLLWPEGERVNPEGVLSKKALKKLHKIVEMAFMEPDTGPVRRTRAIVIVYRGRIVAERYAPGFHKDTPMPGWSLTGAMTNALAGILVRQGRLSTDQCNLLARWRRTGDLRSKITVDNLMRMSSGLRFNEDYSDPQNDLSQMLFRTGDAAAYAAGKRLEYRPGTVWHFSGGSLVILSRVFKDAVNGTEDDYLTFPRRELFRPVGMSTAIIEPDAAGTFLTSSFGYASARDWARLGLLFMRDGVWNGRRILPKGWVKYSTTPVAGFSHVKYGACFWLSIPGLYTTPLSSGLSLPDDSFYAVGQDGQFIAIIPSKKLVIVRLGLTRKSYVWDQKLFTASIIDAISSD